MEVVAYRPIDEWTQEFFEEQILKLPSGEARVELKSSRVFDWNAKGNSEDKLRNELATYLSAFANYEGGLVVYGVKEDKRKGTCEIDGGVPSVVKGNQPAGEWLRDIVPSLTDPPVPSFGVHVFRREHWDKVEAERCVAVVEIGASEVAPHQSRRDLKYYGRIGDAAVPLQHRLIEDIRSRLKHPKVDCRPHIDPGLQAPDRVQLGLEFTNSGKRKAMHVSALIWVAKDLKPGPRGSLFSAPERAIELHGEAAKNLAPAIESKGYEVRFDGLKDFPILPTCSRTKGLELLTPMHDVLKYSDMHLRHMPIAWEVYADDAPPVRGQIDLHTLVQELNLKTGER